MRTLLRSLLSHAFLGTRILGASVEDWLLVVFGVLVAVVLAQAVGAGLL